MTSDWRRAGRAIRARSLAGSLTGSLLAREKRTGREERERVGKGKEEREGKGKEEREGVRGRRASGREVKVMGKYEGVGK